VTFPSGDPAAELPTDYAIRRFAEQTDTIVHGSEFDRGGHFAVEGGVLGRRTPGRRRRPM
jgi:hypothetical protein